MAPYKIKKECYLLRSHLVATRRRLLFVVEQVFLLMGKVWFMHRSDVQCTVERREGTKGQKKNLHLNFSRLAINYEFIRQYIITCKMI